MSDWHAPTPTETDAMPSIDLRDYFAANALAALIAEPIEGVQECLAYELDDDTTQAFAVAAYRFADAMLKARKA